jgi:PhnB protein
MLRLNPHLTFNGQCEAAFKFYEKCLNGKILMMMTHADSPTAEQTPPGWRSKIMHATLALGDHVFTGGDAPPELYRKPQGFSVLLHIGDAAEADRIFKTLAENGAVQMSLEETFWALRFGMLVDQFGTPWMINCGKPA